MDKQIIKKDNSSRKRILLIISIVSTLIILMGSVYAFFTYSKNAEALTLTSNSITATFTAGSNQVNFTNAYPISDDYALANLDKLTYVDFTVSGNAVNESEAITYEIFLTEDNENTLSSNYVKVYVTDNNGNKATDPATIGSLLTTTYANEPTGKIVLKKTYKGSFAKSYRLYVWLDENYEQNTVSQTFDFYVNIYAYNNTSDNADNVLAKVIRRKLTDANSTPDSENPNIKYISGCSDEAATDETCTDANKINFNFVWYSGKLWRIVAIYPDGEMKLVTENPITVLYWGENSTYSTSWVRTWLNNDFKDTLENQNSVLVSNNNNFVWNATLTTAKTKETTRTGATTDTVGMLDVYEYTKSYEKAGNTYGKGYLNIKQNWWLITPYTTSRVRDVYYDGYLDYNDPASYNYAVRPSIYLKSSVTLSGGTGSRSDPYRIGKDISVGTNGTKINTRVSGEYVTFKDASYRIVGVEGQTTKIVKADYLLNGSSVVNKNFSTGQTYGAGSSDTYWDYYLNSVWLTSEDKTYLDQGTYYLGKNDTDNKDYRLTKCTDTSCATPVSNTYQGYAGLLRVGEMFSSQLRTTLSSYQIMWLITPYSTSYVRDVYNNGALYNYDPASNYGAVRPTVHLKSNIIIASDNVGDGTEAHPYTLAIGSE